MANHFYEPALEQLTAGEIALRQQARFAEMLPALLAGNRFVRAKFQRANWYGAYRPERWSELPFTTKTELVMDAEAHPPYGSNLTYPLERYLRLHQTSGTTGRALAVLDTAESWEGWNVCWQLVLRAAGVQPGDCVYVAFSFGPFVGFWAGFEAVPRLGCRVLTGGGQSSVQRLRAILEHRATVLVCTPSYALHLAEVAREQRIDIASSPVRITLHAGEPGASIPATKKRIEELWGARCFDHIGASEVGPYGFECDRQPGGVHVNELDFICESIDPAGERPVAPGEIGELVLTNLNRWGFPVIRYRTGDLVRLSEPRTCDCGRSFRLLQGGVFGRADDMMTIRGVNVFPSAIESVVRRFREVVEYEGHVFTREDMDQMLLRVELRPAAAGQGTALQARIREELRNRLSLRIEVELAAAGSLPRHELKARRFHRRE